MAQKRMFSMRIVDTDAFLDMPQSSQLLYFHLSMRADDDGFVSNPKRIMKIVGSQDDDIKVLFLKRFLIPFDSGVCVIKHWRINNYIQNDRYTPTTWLNEKSILKIKENGAYTLEKPEKPKQLEEKVEKCIQNVSTDLDLDLDIDLDLDATQGVATLNHLISLFKPINPSFERIYPNKNQRAALQRLVDKYGEENVEKMILALPEIVSKKFAPRITTPYQLEQKLGDIKLFLEQEKQINNKYQIKI